MGRGDVGGAERRGATGIDGRRDFGAAGEQLIVEHLERSGYRVVDRNVSFRCGELDIVAEQGALLCFVEVRRRATGRWGDPSATVTWTKQRKIVLAAMTYVTRRRLLHRAIRFDVASVVGRGCDALVEYYPGAFDAGAW